MSKSDVGLVGMYAGIFQDATRAYPALEKEFSKDFSSLRRSIEARGIRLLTVDLVSCGKHFDRCLAQGRYEPSHLPLTKRASKAGQAPKFLRGLFLLVFNRDGSLKESPDIEAIFFIRQIYLFAKKANYVCPQAAINREVKALLDHDASLPQPDASWDSEEGEINAEGFNTPDVVSPPTSDADIRRRGDRSLLWILDRVSSILTSSLGPFDPSSWRFKHGPGAVSEGSRYTNKYCWRSWDPHLEREFPIADYGFHSYASWAGSVQSNELPGKYPVASRLVAVPKTALVPRLIAAEPASKQWCQQNLLDYFVSRTERSWISQFVHFRDQTRNQTLCIRGSSDGNLCTIDLSAASDSVSCWFVGNLFKANPTLLRALRAVRTRHLSQTINPDCPEITPLRKYSMMGSAVTFPIESLGFLAICLSGILHARGRRPSLREIKKIRDVSVFGDDLVIPKDSWDSVTRLLELCKFKVNQSKSFKEGNFRESCGVDSFMGVGITPTYWRGPYTEEPESVLSLIELHNHLYQRFLMCSATKVRNAVKKFPDVSVGSGAIGLHSRLPIVVSTPSRFCKAHHVWKTLVYTVTGSSKRLAFNDNCALLQYFTESPSPFSKWENGVQSRVRMSIRRRWSPVHDLIN